MGAKQLRYPLTLIRSPGPMTLFLICCFISERGYSFTVTMRITWKICLNKSMTLPPIIVLSFVKSYLASCQVLSFPDGSITLVDYLS